MTSFNPTLRAQQRSADIEAAKQAVDGYDPHSVSNAVILALTEVREMFGLAMCGQELPTPLESTKPPANP